MSRQTSATTIDEYLAFYPKAVRSVLEQLRKIIKSTAPKATEGISYQVPTFKHHGPLVGFAAFKDHCSLFVMSPEVLKSHKAKLKGYVLGKGTIQFEAEKPLPAALVKAIVRARVVENESRALLKRKKSA